MAERMSRYARRAVLPLGILALSFGVAALFVALTPEVEKEAPAEVAPVVEVVRAERSDVVADVRSQGTVRARTRTTLAAEVSGRIRRIGAGYREGAFFEEGDLLLAIDPRDHRIRVEDAKAGVAQAEVALEQAEAQAEIAREEWASLGRGEPSALALRKPQLAQANAALAGAEAALRKARLDLVRATVRAPFDGRLATKHADLAQWVAPGTPLAELIGTDVAEVRLPVSKRDLAFVPMSLGKPEPGFAGVPVSLRGPSQRPWGSVATWPARAVRTAEALDPKTRMLSLVAEVEDPFALQPGTTHPPLPMGMFVEARIHGKKLEDVVVIPPAALSRGDRVWIVDDEDRLRPRRPEILRVEETRVILSGKIVRAGERLVVSLLQSPVDGMSVRPHLAGERTPAPQAAARRSVE